MSDFNENVNQELVEKWGAVLDEKVDGRSIEDSQKRALTAIMLENTEKELAKQSGENSYLQENNVAGSMPDTGGVAKWDPVMISLVRRAMPNLMAYDIAGVQPMTGPTGLIFAMKSKYGAQNGTEALFNEADTAFSATNANGDGGKDLGSSASAAGSQGPDSSSLVNGGTDTTPNDDVNDAFNMVGGMTTAEAEALGTTPGTNDFNEMAFSIEKTTVTARTRALKAEYTMELAQDLKAVHGLNAETELANILSGEILAEINREMVGTINSRAVLGGFNGAFDLQNTDHADGRWFAEKIKGLVFAITREANQIAIKTRRGAGNFIICSSNVAAAFSAAGALDSSSPFNGTSVNSDVTQNTFAGKLGNLNVYVDPYATVDYVNVGYKGTNPFDAGIFYAPYVPLTMVRAQGEHTFQPKIGFKTRYGMVANPYMDNTGEIGAVRTNEYYRIFAVQNII
jgi:hypothetical protein